MSDYTRIVLETDLAGARTTLSALDDRRAGHGHRLSGPKLRDVDPSSGPTSTELDAEDCKALIEYGELGMQIALRDSDTPDEVWQLAQQLRWYLSQSEKLARVSAQPSTYGPEVVDRWRKQVGTRAGELAAACDALAAVLREPADEPSVPAPAPDDVEETSHA